MKRLREVLRLKFMGGLSNRAIGRAVNISPGTVSYYTRAAEQAQLDKALIDQLSDEELINKVKPHCLQCQFTATVKCEPDYVLIYQELKKKGVTLQLLHEEYQERQGKKQSYSYSIFCQRFRTWLKKQKPSLRMLHTGGEKIFVDYAGPTIAIYDGVPAPKRKKAYSSAQLLFVNVNYLIFNCFFQALSTMYIHYHLFFYKNWEYMC